MERPSDHKEIEFSLLLPAAGMGTRMGETIPKALVPFNGVPLVEFATCSVAPISTQVVTIVSPSAENYFKEHLISLHGRKVEYVLQETPRGTAEAVKIGVSKASQDISVIVWADHIGCHFFSPEVLVDLLKQDDWEVLVPIVERADPYVYFELSEEEMIVAFHETRFGAPQRDIGWSDCGIFIARTKKLDEVLKLLPTSTESEVNFLSLLPLMTNFGVRVKGFVLNDHRLTLGANSREELARVSEILK